MSTITVAEAKETMATIVKNHLDGLRVEMQSLPKDAKNEKKACSIALNMLGIAQSWAAQCGDQQSYAGRVGEDRNAFLAQRVFAFPAGTPHALFDAYKEAYDELSIEDKGIFLTYAHCLYMIHNAFFYKHYNQYLSETESDEVPEKPGDSFACRVILTTLTRILTEWKQWWDTTDILPCTVDYWSAYAEKEGL